MSVWTETHNECAHWRVIFEPTSTNIVWPKDFLIKEVRSYHPDGMVYVRMQAPMCWRELDIYRALRAAGIDRELYLHLETAYPWITHTGVYDSVIQHLKDMEALRQLREAGALAKVD